ncbi:hypothetical protein RRG08_011379 [Elysia crispata]|uniref:Uncharacterized protein n=1 Tax=Elysia crispata TaxID=231223 RepID=A0AAE0ZL60_9GAST|nr:hypothetical protein RRG08_011379 [Elysia crispata]
MTELGGCAGATFESDLRFPAKSSWVAFRFFWGVVQDSEKLWLECFARVLRFISQNDVLVVLGDALIIDPVILHASEQRKVHLSTVPAGLSTTCAWQSPSPEVVPNEAGGTAFPLHIATDFFFFPSPRRNLWSSASAQSFYYKSKVL